MIFYFSGTGNSRSVAEALCRSDEKCVDVAQAYKASVFSFEKAPKERVGFVFPTYCFTLGDIIVDFLSRLEIEGDGYCFAVVTCGGAIGGTAGYLKKLLAKRGLTLCYATPLLMPDNTVFYYEIKNGAQSRELLGQAALRLEEIKREIEAERTIRVKGDPFAALCRGVYHLINGTKAFYAEESCIGCGLCAKNCPSDAIVMENGRPTWRKKKCMKCTACINRCPVRAIQHGKNTKDRERYVNPGFPPKSE